MVSVSLDFSLFVQIFNILVLTLVLNQFLYKPLRRILNERQVLFDSYRELADVAKKQLEDGDEEMTKRRTEALAEGVETMKELKTAGQTREREILAIAQETSAKRLEEARTRLAQESTTAREALAIEANILAKDLAERLLGRQV
ncbi:MAG: ATP synthase F0 subunit B [Deltaproteobacteria bacterium]|jgi:F-type H+-transporting ATPase subunit b|nr:ATP synthase F0 subunit B [Deltaproteobacteria bacterium]